MSTLNCYLLGSERVPKAVHDKYKKEDVVKMQMREVFTRDKNDNLRSPFSLQHSQYLCKKSQNNKCKTI